MSIIASNSCIHIDWYNSDIRSDNKVHVSNQKIKIPFLMNENSFDAKLSKTLLQKIKL